MIAQEIWLNLRKYHCKRLKIYCRVCKNLRLRAVTREDGLTIKNGNLSFFINPVFVLVPENNYGDFRFSKANKKN